MSENISPGDKYLDVAGIMSAIYWRWYLLWKGYQFISPKKPTTSKAKPTPFWIYHIPQSFSMYVVWEQEPCCEHDQLISGVISDKTMDKDGQKNVINHRENCRLTRVCYMLRADDFLTTWAEQNQYYKLTMNAGLVARDRRLRVRRRLEEEATKKLAAEAAAADETHPQDKWYKHWLSIRVCVTPAFVVLNFNVQLILDFWTFADLPSF